MGVLVSEAAQRLDIPYRCPYPMCSRFCALHMQNRLLRPAVCICRKLQVRAEANPHSFREAEHHEWRVRLFDTARARCYAIDIGHFPAHRFLGPSAFVVFSRTDITAGRPNSFRIPSKQLEKLTTAETDLSLGIDVSANEHCCFKVSDIEFRLFTQAYGALLSIQSTSVHAERQLSGTNTLLHDDTSYLKGQVLR